MPNSKTLAPSQVRGFALYVGISETEAQEAGLTLTELATALKETIQRLVPDKASETYAALALAPDSVSGRNLDLTRIALGEPRATVAKTKEVHQEEPSAAKGLVVDLNRKKLFADGRQVSLTCREFALFSYLIENTGRTISRAEIAGISDRCGEPTPNDRTIDVHVRRLRSKISGYEDVIRTQRGVGYRFDKHPDVLIEQL